MINSDIKCNPKYLFNQDCIRLYISALNEEIKINKHVFKH